MKEHTRIHESHDESLYIQTRMNQMNICSIDLFTWLNWINLNSFGSAIMCRRVTVIGSHKEGVGWYALTPQIITKIH